MSRPKKKNDDILTLASAEARRLGISYWEFEAMCRHRYPKCPNPIARYFEDQYLAGKGTAGLKPFPERMDDNVTLEESQAETEGSL